ncbi:MULTISPECIES: hypothetical protein [unclassified Rhizobium]|uniref:hypothetical protein n=1 Tax=unclassified Rhizobium TaxID=2613769 RepID=UPI00160352E4|nr:MULTISPECIES: hypothetical protein [unclassified Rhizobium]MBB1250632.1 hypothetical protein [Rhizobium sp. G21]MCV3764631.1 hypothetical protein [Rhizobium sp. TRM95796]
MKTSLKMLVAASTFGLAAAFTGPAAADSLTIRVAPNPPAQRVIVRPPVVKKVVVRQACYTKTVKKVTNNKTVITKQRVCP